MSTKRTHRAKLMKVGRPPVYAKRVLRNRFNLNERQLELIDVDQIVHCKDNSAIRLLMGISEKDQRGIA